MKESWCRTCRYWGAMTQTCDYLLLTGKRRQCPPGEGCTRKERGNGARPESPVEWVGRSIKIHAPDTDGGRLQVYRAAMKLTQKQLAKKTGIPRTTISAWERGTNRVNWGKLEKHIPGIREAAQRISGAYKEPEGTR